MPATLQSKEFEGLGAIAEGSNKFATDLYQQLKDQPGNIVVSPVSAQIVLALAYSGAGGKTAEEMSQVLHLPSSREHVLEGHKALLLSLKNPVLNMATKMFLANNFNVSSDFKAVADNYFMSGLEEKDFPNNPGLARSEINSWVEDHTNKKIKDLLSADAVNSDTRLILVNAIHFKAKWLHAFKPESTKEAPFHISLNETVNVQMMRLTGKKFKFAHSETLDAKILEMPYEGNQFSLICICPNKIDGLAQVESKLSSISLGDELSKLHETTCDVEIPKFKIEASMNLNEALQNMGMKSAFSDSADFKGISDRPLKVSSVVQKAFIEVNEEGTEAAAATAASLRMRRAVISAEEIICNRPFGFMLVSPPTGSVIFASRLMNIPEYSPHTPSHEEL